MFVRVWDVCVNVICVFVRVYGEVELGNYKKINHVSYDSCIQRTGERRSARQEVMRGESLLDCRQSGGTETSR